MFSDKTNKKASVKITQRGFGKHSVLYVLQNYVRENYSSRTRNYASSEK